MLNIKYSIFFQCFTNLSCVPTSEAALQGQEAETTGDGCLYALDIVLS